MEGIIIIIVLSFISRLIRSTSNTTKKRVSADVFGRPVNKAKNKREKYIQELVETENNNSSNKEHKGDKLKEEIAKEREIVSKNEHEFQNRKFNEKIETIDTVVDKYSTPTSKSRDLFDDEYVKETTNFNSKRLRQAIILSEILDKPVSRKQ